LSGLKSVFFKPDMKSSLLLYVEAVARGKLDVAEQKFKFVTASIDLGGCHTEIDILKTVARGLKTAIAEEQRTIESTKKILDFLSNWEVMGVKFNKPDADYDPEEICDQLVGHVAAFCNSLQGEFDGIVLLLDEADQPPVEANLGKFCKYFTERLTRKDCNNILIGMAGLPQILLKLKDSHESSPRLFETLLLKPLEIEECKTVVNVGLRLAKQKSGQETTISDDALAQIADISEGYPHFVQQFSYSAFDQDSDGVIKSDDVWEGANKENGAIAQLGRKYFNELYYGKIGSNDYRLVLNSMAEHSDQWIARKNIVAESGVKSTTVNNALNALKARNIIVLDETRPGYYRLPTKSFAAWINAVKSVSQNSPHAKVGLEGVFEP
jgi:hypothetical protein